MQSSFVPPSPSPSLSLWTVEDTLAIRQIREAGAEGIVRPIAYVSSDKVMNTTDVEEEEEEEKGRLGRRRRTSSG